jgi:hypothetical protein
MKKVILALLFSACAVPAPSTNIDDLDGQTDTKSCDTNCTNDSDCHPTCGSQYHCDIGVGWHGSCVATRTPVSGPLDPIPQACGIECSLQGDCAVPACNYCAKQNPWTKGNCISGVALSPEERAAYDAEREEEARTDTQSCPVNCTSSTTCAVECGPFYVCKVGRSGDGGSCTRSSPPAR